MSSTSTTEGFAPSSLCDFESFLKSPSPELQLNLSNASMVDVLQAYAESNRINSPRYTNSSVVFNIKRLEKQFGCTIRPAQVSKTFYSLFQKYLIENIGLKASSIRYYFDTITASLRWATRYKCPVSDTFDVYKVPKYHKTKVCLTSDMVSHIYHYDLSSIDQRHVSKDKVDNLYRVRDMFVLACNLGQRYSDMVRITPDHFDSTGTVLTIVQQKSGQKAVVNILEYSIDKNVCLEILKRYNYHAPYTGHISNYNKTLHKILEHIGMQFDKDIITESRVKGEITVEKIPLHKLVSSHTARRTFITQNAVIREKPELKVRRCSGHADGRHFQDYCIFDEI